VLRASIHKLVYSDTRTKTPVKTIDKTFTIRFNYRVILIDNKRVFQQIDLADETQMSTQLVPSSCHRSGTRVGRRYGTRITDIPMRPLVWSAHTR
jgi:hypothetical protein